MKRARRRMLGKESLESRLLLAGDGLSAIATYRGIARAGEPASFPLHLSSEHFSASWWGDTLLSLRVQGDSVRPAAPQVVGEGGQSLTPRIQQTNLPDLGDSLAIYHLRPGQYTVTASGEQDAPGVFLMQVGLTGDLDGDRSVQIDDLLGVILAIRNRIDGLPAAGEADIDGNGVPAPGDLFLTLLNFRAESRIGPLTVDTIQAAGAERVGDIFYTHQTETTLSLQTTPGAVAEHLNNATPQDPSDGQFVADQQGNADVPVQLHEGLNTFRFRVTDPVGQERQHVVQVVRLALEENLPAAPELFNQAVTTDPGVQQMPSVAVNPLDPEHVVIAYMDYSLVDTGYAGIGVAVSRDGGATFQRTAIPLPEDFDQGAANPIARFDDQGRAFVSFMAATFLGPQPPLTNPDFFNADLGLSERTYGYQANNGVFVARSEDGGLNWNAPVAVVENRYNGSDEVVFDVIPDLGIDMFPLLPDGTANANYGNLYVTWTRIYPVGGMPGKADKTEGGTDLMIAVSRDGGQTWQTKLKEKEFWNDANGDEVQQDEEMTTEMVTVIDNYFRELSGTTLGQGYVDHARVTVGPDGDVYVASFGGGAFAVHYSNDAAASFAEPAYDRQGFPDETRIAFDVDFEDFPNADGLPNNRFRTHPVRAIAVDPARPGQVYAAEPILVKDARSNVIDGADLFFARSTDHGLNFDSDFQVGPNRTTILNDDNDGQTATGLEIDEVVAGQAFVRIAADARGHLGVIWYDTRRDPADHRLDVFGAISTDGGLTFSPNFRITSTSFDADAGSFLDAVGKENFYLGDFIGLAMAEGISYAAWTDTRNGNQDIFFASFPTSPPPAPLNDRFEPNDAPDVGSPTNLGSVVQRHLPKLAIDSGDEDWFLVEPAATGQLTVSAVQTALGDRLRLELWNKEATVRLTTGADVFDGEGNVIGEQFVFPSDAGREVLVHVLPTPGSAGTRYALDVQSLTADLGDRVHGVETGSIGPDDVALYLLEAAAPGSLEVRLTSGANVQGDLNLELLEPDGVTVLASGQPSEAPGPGEVERVRLGVRKSQIVLLRVTGEAGSQGDYTLEFTNLDQFTTPEANVLFFPAGAAPAHAALADFNQDGQLDIVVSNALSNTVSLLLGNGDGTFQAPRQFGIGAFVPHPAGNRHSTSGRDIAVADLNRDGNPDVLATNEASADISVLLGRGDGTFDPQRRFDATPGPFALDVGDLNNDARMDVIAVSARRGSPTVAVLLGRGEEDDWSLAPQQTFTIFPDAVDPIPNVRLAHLNADDNLDAIFSGDSGRGVEIHLGNGDGTFTFLGRFDSLREAPEVDVADIDSDGRLDVLVASTNETGEISLLLGNGDGTFDAARNFFAGRAPVAVEAVDFGSSIELPDGSVALGPRDGRVDLVVAVTQLRPQIAGLGEPGVVLLPGRFDDQGQFLGFGKPIRLLDAESPHDLDAVDVNEDGAVDITAVNAEGVFVLFGQPPSIPPNTTPETARDLGTVVHLVQPTQTITPVTPEAFFTLAVPEEVVAGAGDHVLDFSALFASEEGPGLAMEVRNAAGNLLGVGERFRVHAAQGEALQVRIFGLEEDGERGFGAYTLAIDVLPQVVSVEAHALLPGDGGMPAGPTTSIILSLQGDRLETETAENVANYTITFLGADGMAGTADDVTIPAVEAVYSPSTNVDVDTGIKRPTAIKQTVTLLFDQALPAGDYRIQVSPNVQTAVFSEEELALLSPAAGFTGHPVVSRNGAGVQEGADLIVRDLVMEAVELGDFSVFKDGTRFLEQLHDDLIAVLDGFLTEQGDAGTTQALIDQVLARFTPALAGPDGRLARMLVLVLDPISFNLLDPDGNEISYDLATQQYVQAIEEGFVDVSGNVEVVVLPEPPPMLMLNVSHVPDSARGLWVSFDANTIQMMNLTEPLRHNQTSFTINPFAGGP